MTAFGRKPIFVSAERRRVRCTHCKRMMRLRAVAIYPPAMTKILRGLGVHLRGLGFTGPPSYFYGGIYADSHESAQYPYKKIMENSEFRLNFSFHKRIHIVCEITLYKTCRQHPRILNPRMTAWPYGSRLQKDPQLRE